MKVYGGIGSRRTPMPAFRLMVEIGRVLASQGWTLRTGGAAGADTAFTNGMLLWTPFRYELYSPWPGYCKQVPPTLTRPTQRALEIASRYHPRWTLLKHEERMLHGRNVHIVLGRECDMPLRFIVCWTPDGSLDGQGPDSGGTGMALRVARGEAPEAEIINLAIDDHWNRMCEFVDPAGVAFDRRERHEQTTLL